MNNNKKVLYLSSELPALSATFVYNELLQLRHIGLDVSAASIRETSAKVDNKTAQEVGHVYIVYNANFLFALITFLKMLCMKPVGVFKSLSWLIGDIFRIGLFSRDAFGLVYRYVYSSGLANYILTHNIQHTHVHFAHVPTDVAMYAACMTDTEFSVTSHANDIFQRGWLLKEKIDRSKFFLTISEFNKTYLSSLASQIKEKIEVIYCGVDITNFTYQEPVEREIFTFGFVARLVEKKGVKYLIKACEQLKNQQCHFRVEIVGDGPLMPELVKLTHELGLDEHIHFLGQMPNHKVRDWLKQLNAFVLPSVKDSNGDMDGIPVSLMEAMASGIPVISTDLSGIKELVIHEQTGFLAISADETDLANKMKDMLATESNGLKLICEQAQNHVTAYFNQRANAEKIALLISG